MRASQGGFTLIEMVTALAVLAILCTLALPSMERFSARSTRVTRQDDLVMALHAARSAAITQGGDTMICPSRDGEHCADGEHWEMGWLAGFDRDHDGAPDDMPFLTGQGDPQDDVVILGATSRPRVRFHADGSAPGSNLRLTVCTHQPGSTGGAIVVANSGRIRLARARRERLDRCRSE
ncbi:GspH/FimT family pseudopilin [Oleiagrimonas sp. C23AA]|uniref:GspH/FimT family pseudopilin n=1 Tax=Oleiagrimonas sp. C23AA TaxID=2719047 RepID=UPI0014215582|nr:GspH/FimT family pseudopilin [Oleiagrimonas sp. C23AA]NII11486.1 prepilin-type N-terminal cleavage/methylation domain-containing protein [Oleiagrimonas sp. C23AA]